MAKMICSDDKARLYWMPHNSSRPDQGAYGRTVTVRTLCQMDTEPQVCEFGYGHGQYHAWPPKHSELTGIIGPTDASLNVAKHHGK